MEGDSGYRVNESVKEVNPDYEGKPSSVRDFEYVMPEPHPLAVTNKKRTPVRKFPMASDIFGLGDNKDLPAMIGQIKLGKKVITTPTMALFEKPAGKPSTFLSSPMGRPASCGDAEGQMSAGGDWRPPRRNCRELGGNPITGEGYPSEIAKAAAGRRLFPTYKSPQNLW